MESGLCEILYEPEACILQKFFSDRLDSTNQLPGFVGQAAKGEFEIPNLLLV
jgi:hypothetical protein